MKGVLHGLHVINDLPHPDGSEGVLAIVIEKGFQILPGTRFLTDRNDSIQVGTISYEAGHRIPAHRHLPSNRGYSSTQEVLFVRKGMVELSVFNSFGDLVLDRHPLGEGDAVALLSGGHSLTFLESTEIVECKSGPYLNRSLDKADGFLTKSPGGY